MGISGSSSICRGMMCIMFHHCCAALLLCGLLSLSSFSSCVSFVPTLAPIRLFRLFFQAEDGIRDLVRSRGLGDVYKRQVVVVVVVVIVAVVMEVFVVVVVVVVVVVILVVIVVVVVVVIVAVVVLVVVVVVVVLVAVSYTHLTLPTICSV